MLSKPLMMSVAILLLGGCTVTTGTGVTSACEFWKPVSWSVRDTPSTVESVKVNNAKQKAWCER